MEDERRGRLDEFPGCLLNRFGVDGSSSREHLNQHSEGNAKEAASEEQEIKLQRKRGCNYQVFRGQEQHLQRGQAGGGS